MSLELERQLIEMGIIPASPLEELGTVCQSLQNHRVHMTKGYFNDPRDENGAVPFY
jgi:hypothetical protein